MTPALLAACNRESEDLEALPKTGTSEGKVVYSTWGTPERREAENWSLLAFERNYPDLKVDVVWAPAVGEYLGKLHALLAGGTPPDVLRLPSWSAPTFYYEEAVRRLDALIRRDGFKLEHLAPPLDVATYKRSLHALPRGVGGAWVVFYNRRLFDQAGLKAPANSWTWDDFLTAARALTRPGGPWGTALEPLTDFYYPWLWGNGAEEYDRAGQHATLDQPAAREALQWLADLRLKHKVAPAPGDVPAGLSAFATGRVAMWYGPADLELELAKLSAPDYAIAPQPRGKLGQQAGYKPDVVALATGSQHTDDAWELLQFLVDVDTQRLEFENGLWLPQSKVIVNSDAYQRPAGPPYDRRPGIPGAVLRARTPIIFPRGDEMRAVVLKELAPFWQGVRSIQDATDAAVKGVNAILNGEA
jgi:multiple sugar transport system substrate-binding protein